MNRLEAKISSHAIKATLAALMLLSLVACKKEVVGTLGEPLQEKGAPVAVTLEGYTLERVETEGAKGPLVYKKPVLVLDLKFENKGGSPFFYQPTHSSDKASNLQAPLLFVDPGAEGELTQNIPGVFLEEGLLRGQKEGGTQIAAGEAIVDRYIFSPPEQTDLDMVLTIPASLHGGKGQIKVKLSYAKPELPAVQSKKPGDAIKMGDVTVTVLKSGVEYVKLKDTNAGDGFSKDPVYKVSYKIENNGASEVTYKPSHGASGEVLAPSLSNGSARYMRVRFGADREVAGQVNGSKGIAAGKSLTDVAIFERPPKGVNKVQLMLPGKLFGQKGMARVDIPYAHTDPAKPAELEPKKEEDAK